VKVHYVGTLMDGSKFDSSRDRAGFFDFKVGTGQVIKGWDVGIMSMHKGEVATLICRQDYAYGERGSPPKIPGGATLSFEVELFSWKEERKGKFELGASERLAETEALKVQGTAAFKAAQFDEALELYGDAAKYVDEELPKATDEEAAARTPLLLSCLLNAAMCALKLGEHATAEEHCNSALDADPASVKALFRRGTARMNMAEWATAKADLREASKLDPKSKEVRETFAECQKREAAAKQKEKDIAAKMFGGPAKA